MKNILAVLPPKWPKPVLIPSKIPFYGAFKKKMYSDRILQDLRSGSFYKTQRKDQ